MTEKIEPALTAEERAGSRKIGADVNIELFAQMGEWAKVIAAANDELPDSDPRKITREKVEAMRKAAWNVPDGWSGNPWLADFADALESYLPPEPTFVPITTSKRTIQPEDIASYDMRNGTAILRDGTVLTSPDRIHWTVRNPDGSAE